MAEKTRVKKSSWTPASVVMAVIFHLIGISLIFVTILAITISLDVARSVAEISWGNALIQEAVAFRTVIQFGLAACVWAMGCIFFKSVDMGMVARRTPRVVRRARGTVITETIIIFPLFLFLVLGLAQLTLNNLTAVLKQVASFQAARTAWVWVPEMDAGTVSPAEVENRVRIAAALALTPIAPGNYPAAGTAQWTQRAQEIEDIMVSRFDTSAGGGGSGGQADRMSMVEGLDGNASQTMRAQRKFRHAYNSIHTVEVHQGDQVGATVTYFHAQSMPLVGRVFGEDGGNGVHYQHHTMTMTIPSQLYDVCRLNMDC